MRIIAISMRYDIRDNNVLHDFYIKFGEMKTRGGHGRTPGLVRGKGKANSPRRSPGGRGFAVDTCTWGIYVNPGINRSSQT
jgi:hypothetical protein